MCKKMNLVVCDYDDKLVNSNADGFIFNSKESLFYTFWRALAISCLFDNSYYERCDMISHCGFDLHFPNDW